MAPFGIIISGVLLSAVTISVIEVPGMVASFATEWQIGLLGKLELFCSGWLAVLFCSICGTTFGLGGQESQ